MTRTKSLALAFYLGAALAGAAIGVAVDRMAFRGPRFPDQRDMRARFYNELTLTPAQRDSVSRIFDERSRQDSMVRAQMRPKRDSLFAQARQRIVQLLTPEQKAIYDQMQQAQRDRQKSPRQEKR